MALLENKQSLGREGCHVPYCLITPEDDEFVDLILVHCSRHMRELIYYLMSLGE